jgi:hypothetical protein
MMVLGTSCSTRATPVNRRNPSTGVRNEPAPTPGPPSPAADPVVPPPPAGTPVWEWPAEWTGAARPWWRDRLASATVVMEVGTPLGNNVGRMWSRVLREADGGRGDFGTWGPEPTKPASGPTSRRKRAGRRRTASFATGAAFAGTSSPSTRLLGLLLNGASSHPTRRGGSASIPSERSADWLPYRCSGTDSATPSSRRLSTSPTSYRRMTHGARGGLETAHADEGAPRAAPAADLADRARHSGRGARHRESAHDAGVPDQRVQAGDGSRCDAGGGFALRPAVRQRGAAGRSCRCAALGGTPQGRCEREASHVLWQ